MDVRANAALAALAARLRLNGANGNVVNGSTPGAAIRRASTGSGSSVSSTTGRSASAAYGGRSASATPQRAVPAGFAQLKLDLPELIEHLANAKELYTAYSVVSKTANQMYGTMLDILEDSGIGDGEEIAEEDAGIVGETEIELRLEALETNAVAGGGSDDCEHVPDAGFEASA